MTPPVFTWLKPGEYYLDAESMTVRQTTLKMPKFILDLIGDGDNIMVLPLEGGVHAHFM